MKVVERLSTVGNPMVFILNERRLRLVPTIVNHTSAFVDMMLPGPHGAGALCDLLFGTANFVGRLTVSDPKSCHNHVHNHGNLIPT